MWVIVAAISFVFGIFLACFRLIWTILKPILLLLYQGTVNVLIKTGMTKRAAEAIVSVVVSLIILLIIIANL